LFARRLLLKLIALKLLVSKFNQRKISPNIALAVFKEVVNFKNSTRRKGSADWGSVNWPGRNRKVPEDPGTTWQ
jgi:hypothetical protein